MTFLLSEKAKESVCGYIYIRRDHPKLLILGTRPGGSILQYKRPLLEPK